MVDPLEQMIRRERRRQLVLPAVIAAVGAPFAIYGVWYAAARHLPRDAWQPIAIGVALLAIATAVWRRVHRYGGRLARSEDVVWIYEHTLKRNGVAHHSVCFGYADGQLEAFSVIAPLVKQPALRAAIDTRFPAARRGYSTELAAAFKRDPRAVRS